MQVTKGGTSIIPKPRRAHSQPRQSKQSAPPLPGLPAREAAVRLLSSVLNEGHAFDGAIAKDLQASTLEPRDRALARLIAATVLRRLGQLEAILNSYLEKPLPKKQGALWPILLSGAAQLLFLDTPPHAAVGLAVEQARRDRHAGRYDKLVNALLRRAGREGKAALEQQDAVALNIPAWMLQRWTAAYGSEAARAIAGASLNEAPLDVSVKSEPEVWAERLGGTLLPTGSVRLAAGGRVDALPGFAEGAWWVQDAAAALPARLLGDVADKSVVDLCAAPGGKTAQLAAAGARVTALDLVGARLQRLRANLERLQLSAELVEADAGTWLPESRFDAVLLDAPCTATGTIRRHPDILRLKRPEDVAALAEIQSRLLDNAAGMLAPGGTLLYCTCSLEPEEGANQIVRFLERHPNFKRRAIVAGESGVEPEWLTRDGDLRTLPSQLSFAQPEMSGLDGFYAARLVLNG
ncbi:16S rRNA (cytosine967-C5)-methyltransferase [Hyphomicrobium sp. 1Nfss2.1]|uniref:RsmB/NOP family class I SAM-dependent RNA methyltransferase n=1 Tax=Hyphomicrobium sp. 1Nfss2.1 TaxID=3413936 RepID=UPI003C7E3664